MMTIRFLMIVPKLLILLLMLLSLHPILYVFLPHFNCFLLFTAPDCQKTAQTAALNPGIRRKDRIPSAEIRSLLTPASRITLLPCITLLPYITLLSCINLLPQMDTSILHP